MAVLAYNSDMKASKWETKSTDAAQIRAYLIVRNDLIAAGHSATQQGFLALAEEKRQQVIARFPTVKSYIAFMAGYLAATPLSNCRLYGHGMKPMRASGGTMPKTKLVSALGGCDINTLPLMVEIHTARKTIQIPL